MTRTFYLLLAAIIIVSAFVLGRISLILPAAQEAEFETVSEIEAAYENFIGAQTETLDFFKSQDFFDSSQHKAEAYRTLLWSMVGAIKMDALHDRDYPRFIRSVDYASKSGLDNPDNTYFVTQLHDDGEYKITGTRGTTSGLVFQLLLGRPGVGNAGTSTNIDILYADDMLIDPFGNFEIIVSRKNPGDDLNWLELKEGAKTLIVRHTHADWNSEGIGALNIVSLKSDTHSDVLSEEIMTARLDAAATAIRDRNKSWITLANRIWDRAPRNVMTPPRPTPGGLVGQYSAFGTFDLAKDEALILTSHMSDADYQGIQLGNLWFTSLDYETRTSSLTPAQSYQSPDGAFHYVISNRDPGIQNWLDPEGHKDGLIMMRWQGKSAEPPQSPIMRKVKFQDLQEVLPERTPTFTEIDRKTQILERQMAVQKRFP